MTISQYVSVLPVLALVVALVLLSGWMARRAAGRFGLAPQGGARVRVVERLALDPRRRVHLLCCDGRHLLLLTGGGTDVVLGWLDAPDAGGEP